MFARHKLLGSEAELRLLYEDRDGSHYGLRLRFVDLLGRTRQHNTIVSLSPTLRVEPRISFTAMSSVNARVGIVTRLDSASLYVLLCDGKHISVGRRSDFDFMIGQEVYIVERIDMRNDYGNMTLIAIPVSAQLDQGMMCLQSVNADILDQEQRLLHRLGVDPLHKRGASDKRMAT